MNPLVAYTYDLTQAVLDINASPLTGYDTQLDRIFQILHRKEKMNNKYNPLLLDLDGIARWHVISAVARRIATGEAPDFLCARHIIVLNYETLLMNLSIPPEDEILARLQALFLAIRQTEGQVLLFVDHFHRIIGGEKDRYPIDAAILLKPILARREIQLVGASKPEEYHRHIERDAAISRRFQEVRLTDEL